MPDADLGAKVAFLSRAESYPEPTSAVDPVETHMAWVFLTDTHAYKLKKPVRFDYLDFSTIQARRRMCEAEVRLNRRLAPEVYLGTVPLRIDAAGQLGLTAGRSVVDWLVKMRRLPAPLMLDALIRDAAVPPGRLVALGRLLGGFYRWARRVRTLPQAYLDRTTRDIDETERELLRFGLTGDLVGPTVSALRSFVADRGELLADRALRGAIVDGHGDLRPEHVCLTPVPVVIDCIEFNRAFRTLDPVDDLAYLALECRRLGAPEIGPILLAEYARETGDQPPAELIRFYEGFRAALRAKIAIWHLRDAVVEQPEHWVTKASVYLALAETVLRIDPSPLLHRRLT